MRGFKRGARFLGIDDSPFAPSSLDVLVVGVVERDGLVEGVLSTRVRRDGDDATEKLCRMLSQSRFLAQVKAILLNSVNLAGFNVVDIRELSARTKKPVIAVVRRKPDAARVMRALANVPNAALKAERMARAGGVAREGSLFFQRAGISEEGARLALRGGERVPESIRLAHVIAGGIARGESGGRV
jgi:endonuclease V-like protein UPF0215 family